MTVQATQRPEPEWIWLLFRANRMLGLGSVSLLAGTFFLLLRGIDPIGFSLAAVIFATVVALVLQLMGWVALNEAAARPLMRVIFISSLVGPAVGIAITLLDVPNPGLFLFFGGWLILPYLPFVFGPAAIAHAILYGIVYARLGSRPSILVAGLALVVVVVIGIAFEIAIAGFTCVGYGIATQAFKSEYLSRRVHLSPFVGPGTLQASR
jgi:hypothetical protein